MQGVNLIPAYRLEAAHLRRRARLWSVAWLACAALVAASGLVMHSTSAQASDVTDEALQRAVSHADELTRSITKADRELAEAQTRLAAGRALSDRPDWSMMLVTVSKLLGTDNVLSVFKLRAETAAVAGPVPGGAQSGGAQSGGTQSGGAQPAGVSRYKLEIAGMGRSQESVSEFVLRLQGTGLFEEVKFIRSAREPFMSGEAVAFGVECTLVARVQP